ncbi:MotA/TolQ/ExbB proton channel family protein [Herbaspirillum rubrisubalbicans]|uniref:MotA/TolQ/ExbB proton channel family protein n=1 Tax=Herbaspirillum rubrisubalbicans TaxID=80842 RepID=A0AAD0U7R9_9BURK|nr:MotA/TolQ/ExbB proton channel family protein [Herbaspirillum rubrisubalbicans]ALU89595.1 MotA/TolQ/ExbB proton channel family protein [Herbaspirillum rubrisubalbicans M1]AYR24674.1 MotA/TolQ/ExbB proton channel family protein [Herbaspirillum rubrisubalbicans]
MNAIQLFHELTFYAMYVAAALAVFMIVERQLFFMFSARDALRLLRTMSAKEGAPPVIDASLLERQTVPAQLVREALQVQGRAVTQAQREDLGEAIYIAGKKRVNARLWVLDTIVTAAPLLGLVGTILGIIDTFAVLASSGISDPSGVSKGIGTALYATALGISIALFGLLFYNYLRECADNLNDLLKELLLRSSGLEHGHCEGDGRGSREGSTVPRNARHPVLAAG